MLVPAMNKERKAKNNLDRQNEGRSGEKIRPVS